MSQGKLVGIATRTASRAPMVELERAEVTLQRGVERDFRGKPGSRQVTVLSADAWRAACAELGQTLPWTTRRANLLIEGIDLADSAGATLAIGDVVLRISGETEPCSRMEEACAGLHRCLEPDWRGGVSCAIMAGGRIELGATVELQREDS